MVNYSGGGSGTSPGSPVVLAAVKWALANTDTGIGQKPLTNYTYANGTAGVGATVTHNVNGALSIDGGTPAVGDRVLVSDPYAGGTGNPPHPDGIYTVTSTGGAGSAWVLTRSADCNTAALLGRYWAVTITSGTVWGSGFAQVWNLDTGAGTPPFVVGTSFIGIAVSAYASNAIFGGSTAYSGGSGAIGPDATAAGENSLAVGNTSTAVGVYSHAYGPYSVSNSEFGVALGYQTYVNGIEAVGVGSDSNAYGPGMVSFASGRDNTHGDAQGCLQYLVNDTTDATQTALLGAFGQSLHFLDYTGAAAYNKTIWLRFTVVARRWDTVGDFAVFTATGALQGDGSSVYAWNGGTPPTFTMAASGGTVTGWAVAASVATNVLSVKVTGAVGKSISWNCEVRTFEMAH